MKQRGYTPPQPVAVFVSLSLLLYMGDLLFFPPPVESGLADRVVDSIKQTFEGTAALFAQ